MDRLPPRVALAPRPRGVLGWAVAAQRNVLELIPEAALREPIISGRAGLRWHMVMDPGALRRVLKDRVEDYPKSVVTKLLLEPAIGNSMFIAEGAQWRWQRLAAAPAFAARHVEALAPVMTAAAEASAARIAQAPQPFDAHAEMVAATFDIISDVTFSGGESIDRDVVYRAFNGYIASVAQVSLLDVLGLPRWVPRPGRIFSGRVLRETRALADHAIAERARRGARLPPDLLDLLRAGVDPETGRSMNPSELRDNLLTFLVAGHETTALTLSWALYLCAFDPAVQACAAAEAQAAGPRITAAELPRLSYVQQVVQESLRLYPPAAFFSRTARSADTLCGRRIEPGDTVILPIYALHRHRLLWDNPDAFDPDRFAPGVQRDRFAFLPFGGGPRICIGASFALQEAAIILATLLARFDFALVPGRDPYPRMILTLRPEGGVWLRATPR
ncbi:cytochrome P450 [Paracoccus chinensis]|uniref:Cytochrome P450 n=1 Tax=Paracoccus chinensis TaxID=525640 RepID=A0A1G9CL20_9RHOB|nr:cytochrome P450 [Paracoccus chinensis]SDK52401.1 Cytochrome P450 [Paracoccus chinensis]